MKELNFFKTLIIIVIPFFLHNCKSVQVSKDDSEPPKLEMSVFTQGFRDQAMVEANSMPKKLYVAENKKVAFYVSAKDSYGIQSVELEAISGGTLRVNNRLVSKVEKVNDTTSSGLTQSYGILSGELDFDSPTSIIVLRAKAKDWADNTTITPTINVIRVPLPTATIQSNKYTVAPNEKFVLTYTSMNADTLKINNQIINTLNGSVEQQISNSTKYVIEAKNKVGVAKDSIVVNVMMPAAAPKIIYFKSNKYVVEQGESIQLSWLVNNTSRVRILHDGNEILHSASSNSNKNVQLNTLGVHRFTLEARNSDGTLVTKIVSVTVNPPNPCFQFPEIGNFTFSHSEYIYENNIKRKINVYKYHIQSGYGTKKIKSIKNLLPINIGLQYGDVNTIISANATSTSYNNKNLYGFWLLRVYDTDDKRINTIVKKLEICAE